MKDSDLAFGLAAVELGLLTQSQFIEACYLLGQDPDSPSCDGISELWFTTGLLGRSTRSRILKQIGFDSGEDSRGQDIDSGELDSDPDQEPSTAEFRIDSAANPTDTHNSLLHRSPGGLDDSDFEVVGSNSALKAISGGNVLPEGRPALGDSHYELASLYAEGGLSYVWVARDNRLNREVALKILREELAGNEIANSRFRREAQVTGQLEHPHIVPIYEMPDAGVEGSLFYTMRFVEGETLGSACLRYHQSRSDGQDSPLQLLRLLQTFVDVCQAIAFANSRGVIHRDIKPENIVLGNFGEVVVVDWGLAHLVDQPDAIDSNRPGGFAGENGIPAGLTGEGGPKVTISDDLAVSRTLAGAVMGSPSYMAPEQADPALGEVDSRTDVFGLGTTLFAILTGRPPRNERTVNETLAIASTQPIPRARSLNSRVARSLDAICAKATAMHAKDRYWTAGELAEDVQRFLADQPVTARKEPWWEKTRRWINKRRSLVAAASVLLVTLAAALLVGNVFLRREQALTVIARNDAQILASEMMFDRGLLLCQQGDVSPGLLWMAKALELLPEPKNGREELIRTALASWNRHVLPVEQIFQAGAEPLHLEFDKNGDHLLTANRNGDVALWNPHNADAPFETIPHKDGVTSTTILEDGSTILVVDTKEQVHLWRPGGERVGGPLNAPQPLAAVTASVVADRVFVGCNDGSGHLWSISAGARLEVNIAHDTQVLAAVFSDDGKYFAVSDASGFAWLRNGDGKLVAPPLAHDGWVVSLAFSHSGKWLATACDDMTVRLWDIERLVGSETKEARADSPDISFLHNGQIRFMKFDAGDRLLMTGSRDNVVRLWSLAERREVCPPLRHQGVPFDGQFSPDGNHVVTGGTDNVVRTWSTATGRRAAPDVVSATSLVAFGISSDGKRLAILEQDGRVTIRSATQASRVLRLDHPSAVFSIEFDPTGNCLYSGISGQGDTLMRWDIASDKPSAVLFPSAGFIYAIDFLPVSGWLASGGTQSWIRFWEAGNPVEAATPIAGNSPISDLDFAADESRVARATWNGDVEIFSLPDGAVDGEPIHHDMVRCVAFDPFDRNRLCTCGRDSFLRVWDLSARERPVLEIGHPGHVKGLAISRDGKWIATACQDRLARVWDAQTGQLAGSPMLHGGIVNDVAFDPEGKYLATACDDGTARVWDLKTRKETLAPVYHDGPVFAVRFSPDGSRLASSSQDQSVMVSPVSHSIPGSPASVRNSLETLTGLAIDGDNRVKSIDAGRWKSLPGTPQPSLRRE